ncbi:uncharacterized protein BDW70DRAFT_146237 [Aspergillus foveolatus]|uniref:uncharacterized protein n=1 Tax=Aspergillus foveolatus TaxID=210207 RepID=UPI003CCD101E
MPVGFRKRRKVSFVASAFRYLAMSVLQVGVIWVMVIIIGTFTTFLPRGAFVHGFSQYPGFPWDPIMLAFP